MGISKYFLFLITTLILISCGNNPEELIIGEWEEVEWDYEKFDGHSPKDFKKIDGIDLRNYSDRNLIRHEAEVWQFNKNGLLKLVNEEKRVTKTKWIIKGRGHIMKILYDDDTFELYDIKELNEEEMILNYDIGMEVRGIAMLKFKKIKD